MSTQHAVRPRMNAMYPDANDMAATTHVAKFRVGRGGILAIVIFAHLAVLYAVMHFPSMITRVTNAPMQVVMLMEPHHEHPVAPPTPTTAFPETQIQAIEPVINIHSENVSVTVSSHVEETASVATSNVVTPREISSVEYIRKPVAKYPAAARALKQRGVVTLRALIDASGHAHEVNVYRSSGYRLLDDAAREAALDALYKPYTENGLAVPVYVLIPIEFGSAS
jgi:protein TonB